MLSGLRSVEFFKGQDCKACLAGHISKQEPEIDGMPSLPL